MVSTTSIQFVTCLGILIHSYGTRPHGILYENHTKLSMLRALTTPTLNLTSLSWLSIVAEGWAT